MADRFKEDLVPLHSRDRVGAKSARSRNIELQCSSSCAL
jgi:hypothetical protein